ncbi:MAG: helix-turn-helix transcriptional regulator [Anaerococcus sp.]|mgnify:CR=1 FL=1|uniref:helix-turn-helix domain-containing protein n=1 Tax=Anaerococcus sp. TaxID=1872515 RepID=UPI0028FE36F8|nr:helix-turn-helix transcriptional regulator [Anaerococcus sp.]MDU2565510.1 helix-turn-helix transcriptional regulator [Anaerococcus sp.]
MDQEILGKKLKYLRNKSNLSMDKLASNFNNEYGSSISKSMISSWENGRYLISPKNLKLYYQYFKVPPYFLTIDDIPPEDFDKLKLGNYEDYKQMIINFALDDYDDYLNIYYDEKFKDEESKEIIKDEIDFYLNKLNIEGYNKILNYAEDISRINQYLDSEYLRDD